MEETSIQSISHEHRRIPPPVNFRKRSLIKSESEYQTLYQESVKDPPKFWSKKAEELYWFKKWNSDITWDKKKAEFTWFKGGKINVSYNCLDRRLEKNGDKVAIIWQGEPEKDVIKITYRQLHAEVCKFANVLKSKGIRKGDRVCIYLPMIPEAAV